MTDGEDGHRPGASYRPGDAQRRSPRLDDRRWFGVVAVELALPMVPQPHVGLDVHRVVLFNVDVHRHQSIGDDN